MVTDDEYSDSTDSFTTLDAMVLDLRMLATDDEYSDADSFTLLDSMVPESVLDKEDDNDELKVEKPRKRTIVNNRSSTIRFSETTHKQSFQQQQQQQRVLDISRGKRRIVREEYDEEEYYSNSKKKAVATKIVSPNISRENQRLIKTQGMLKKPGLLHNIRSVDNKNKGANKRLSRSDDKQGAKKKTKTSTSRNYNKKTGSSGSGSRSGSSAGQDYPDPNPPPLLPLEVRKLIEESRADEEEPPVLVIQKVLSGSDMKKDQNRLSIPKIQVREKFLREEEKEFLEQRRVDERGRDRGVEYMEVGFIQPNMKKRKGISLRRWAMMKPNGGGSVSYMLTGTWNQVVEDEGYKYGRTYRVQLWAYRVNGKLCFALVNLANPSRSPSGGGGGSSSIASTST